MILSDLLPHLDPIEVTGPTGGPVSGVHHDSRQVGPTDLFAAIRGARIDGRRFARDLDCAGVIADAPVTTRPGVPVIRVADARVALARAAAALHGDVARSLPVVGITGTNGKTTTVALVEAIARATGQRCAALGTTGHRIAGQKLPAAHTTPEAPVIHGLLARARDASCDFAVMEVSSIGLAQHRVDALPFRVAAFTSFSRDHLDFHPSMEAYFDAKKRLFEQLMDEEGTAVLNADAQESARIHPRGRRVLRYGRAPEADIRASDVHHDLSGSRATVRTPAGKGVLSIPLLGSFNLDNALCALGIGLALGLPLEGCLAGLAQAPPVPGRLERVPGPHDDAGITVLVDYAHSPDALRLVLASLRELIDDGRIILVFGCGGDRDAGKRPDMGAAAQRGADLAILTSDNPRSEDPMRIIDDVRQGMTGEHLVEVDRETAIARALSDATSGDVVLIAGKGHETGQVVGDQVRPFDDREVASRISTLQAYSQRTKKAPGGPR